MYLLSLYLCKQTHIIPPETRVILRTQLGRKPLFGPETWGPCEVELQKRKLQSLLSHCTSSIHPRQRGLGKDTALVSGRVLELQSTPKEHRPGVRACTYAHAFSEETRTALNAQPWLGEGGVPSRPPLERIHCPGESLHRPRIKVNLADFPGGPLIQNPHANAGDSGSIPGPGRSHMPWGD